MSWEFMHSKKKLSRTQVTKIGLVDLNENKILEMLVILTEKKDMEKFLSGIGIAFHEFQKKALLLKETIRGIGISVPGEASLPAGIDYSSVACIMQEHFGLPCRLTISALDESGVINSAAFFANN